MLAPMAQGWHAGQVREGYELWRPNREKASSKATKALVALILLISAFLIVIVTLGGWERLQSTSVGVLTIFWAGLYVLFAIMVLGWRRGVLPVAAASAMILSIFAGVAAGAWFARDKDGLESPALPEELLGTLTLVIILVQIALIVVAMVGFNQGWHIEEERPIAGHGGPSDGDGAGWDRESAQPSPAG
jgi:TRAP-type C4-dicarboxylate transport system permease small subunit